jgi:hypothetical protein
MTMRFLGSLRLRHSAALFFVVRSGACGSSTMSLGGFKERSVQECIRKSCIGPKEARDYEAAKPPVVNGSVNSSTSGLARPVNVKSARGI